MSETSGLKILNANLANRHRGVDVSIRNGKFVDISHAQPEVSDTAEVIDGSGCLLSPPFVDSHFHTGAMGNLERALELGVDRIDGSPHIGRTDSEGACAIRMLYEIARDRGLRMEMTLMP